MDKSVSSDIVVATARHQVVRYTSVVSMTVLITDWMCCFSEELDYVWTRKWTFAEYLYLFTRFMPFVDVTISMIYYLTPTISPHECLLNYATGTWLLVVGIGAAELILVWRTYAIWGHSKKIMYGVGATWAVLVLSNVPILTVFTRSLDFDYPPLPQIPGCYLVNASDIAFGSFASLLIMELVIVILTVYKGVQDVRITATPLIKTLYRDGVLFFIYLLMMSLGNIIVLLAVPVEYFDLLINLTRVLHAILCCRVILHLRQVADDGLNVDRTDNTSAERITTLRFKFRRRLGMSTTYGSSEPTTTDESYEMSPSTSAAARETFQSMSMPGRSQDV